jgi:ketosteroid isomerase-like protein
MSDAQLSPLTEWMVKVVAEVSMRPWWRMERGEKLCRVCGAATPTSMKHSASHGHSIYEKGNFLCGMAAVDAALESKPVVQGKAEP